MNGTLSIRNEVPADIEAIHAVNRAAFQTSAESELVNSLRRLGGPVISLVAQEDDTVIGHIMFSPVLLTGYPAAFIMGLAPMAVRPDRQRTGIGSALVSAGLDACRELGAGAVVVLGHAAYYPRFGFTPASRFGLRCEYAVPDDVFMALELIPGYLHDKTGLIRYHDAFGDV